MSYNDCTDSESEGCVSLISDESVVTPEPTLTSVLQVLERLHSSLHQMSINNLNPFDTSPLLALLGQIQKLRLQSAIHF